MPEPSSTKTNHHNFLNSLRITCDSSLSVTFTDLKNLALKCSGDTKKITGKKKKQKKLLFYYLFKKKI